MGYKVFQNGFPLPASDLNNYLMNQSVISFASSTERDSTLTSPVEGQLTYLADTDTYTYYDSAAWQNLIGGGAPIDASLLTTTGDVIYASAAETPARLGVGSDGDVLTVASGVPAWAPPAGGVGTDWVFSSSFVPAAGVSSITITGLTGYSKYLIKPRVNSTLACYYDLKINGTAYTSTRLAISGTGSATSHYDSHICRTSATGQELNGSIYIEYGPTGNKALYRIQTVAGTGSAIANNENYFLEFVHDKPTTSLEITLSAGATTAGMGFFIYGGN